MNIEPVWQALQNPAWVAVGLTAIGLIAAGINFLIIKPIRNRRARKQTEKDVVRNLLRFLENRRVLYHPVFLHVSEDKSVNSVHEIRNRLGEDIERLDEESNATRPIRRMQDACRVFVSRVDLPNDVSRWEFEDALQELRSSFGLCMLTLYWEYDIERGERQPLEPSWEVLDAELPRPPDKNNGPDQRQE